MQLTFSLVYLISLSKNIMTSVSGSQSSVQSPASDYNWYFPRSSAPVINTLVRYGDAPPGTFDCYKIRDFGMYLNSNKFGYPPSQRANSFVKQFLETNERVNETCAHVRGASSAGFSNRC